MIGLFFVGVAMPFRFLFVYAAFLRQGGRDSLPTSFSGSCDSLHQPNLALRRGSLQIGVLGAPFAPLLRVLRNLA